ncbi:Endochitinase B [Tolypocladium ophioglossoides CBS 100239]|uniref:chitinase n=1 Tax=Tolypocladium ophioglossoides (strain CBS 100239) TaxID=1163406 RepID=A0A0L0NE49_TOLOC|nr:Endochitinase B [Tolypocladium ophioglossoides CBS 100239]
MRSSTLAVLAAATAVSATPRYVMYFDQWHKTTLPSKDVTAGVNYVITAFAPSTTFNSGSSYTPFMSVDQVRGLFDKGTKVCMAIGGWGDTAGFSTGAATDETRKAYAKNVATALMTLDYDCVGEFKSHSQRSTANASIDVDWEYPGGNGEDYKRVPNDQKKGEIEAYPLFLAEIKAAIGTKELSIAVPGKVGDMIAFTAEQVPKIDKAVDFINVMTYDLMNRRDNVTNHHTSLSGSKTTVETYIQRGMSPGKMNLGFAFYAKFFQTADTCTSPTGCPTVLMESPDGTDTGKSGATTFEVENFNTAEFVNVLKNGKADTTMGGQWYWDPSTKKFWTWDTPQFIAQKFAEIVNAKKLGGVMAWSLAQDSHDWSHFKAMQAGVKGM